MSALRLLLLLVGSAVASSTLYAESPAGLKRVAILSQDTARLSSFYDSLRSSFRELGYIEGKAIAFEYRVAAVTDDQLQAAAAQLVRLKVDLVFALGTPSARAMSKATSTIPIVFAVADPVEGGLVSSLGRPGGNATGVATLASETGTKRLELLREVLPGATHIAVLANPDNPSTALQLAELQSTARTFGLKLRILKVHGPADLRETFTTIRNQHSDAFVTVSDAVLAGQLPTIAKLALKNRLPGIAGQRLFADSGGLMSYGPDYDELWRRCARYADRILKGAKPSDLPVEQAATFELVINLKTAKTLGVAVPESFLLRANEVIQ